MQQLPAKDQQVFRSIVKFYETKQYKKGVKAADSILKKHPDHGETLCMKGLTLSYLEKKEEAYDLVRKGLKHDIKSHVCWHVFGLLYRQDRNYKQAVNCYVQALKIDPENIQILRDLSLLQIHRRELGGFAETRRKLLQVKPSNRLNWVGYAISEHLCKNFEFAWTCLDNYEKTFKDESVTEYENSELYLYKASIMEESGNLEMALECLVTHESQICDKLGLLEIKSRLLMFLGRYDEAAEIYRKLIKTNSEQHFYILGLMANTTEFHGFWPPLPAPRPMAAEGAEEPTTDEAVLNPNISSFPQHVHPDGMPITGWLPPAHSLAKNNQRRLAIGKRQHKRRIDTYSPSRPLTDEEEQKVTDFIDDLLKEYPKSDSVARVLLYFVTGDRFLARLDAFLRPRLRKGIPSLFRMIRPLYFQEGKAALIEKLLIQYTTYLPEDLSWFGPKWGEKDGVKPDRADEEPPSSLLFARMVLSEHYDYLGETEKALKVCDEAIEHTPTLVEIYACKARIYKHAGDLQESAKWFDEVRQMDLADRFLNTQAVRALLRVDNIKEGVEKVLMFSKEPDAPEAANLHDMQCMWYESAVGRSYYRQHNYGKALKEFHETFKHFSDIAEDQFDFHNYCLRKTTLKTYVAMLRMQERLYSHKFYRRAAKDAVRIYLELYDKKQSGDVSKDDEENGKDDEAEMSAADKKKLKHKMKREKKKEEEVAPQTDAKTGKPKKVDEDPDGKKLLEKDPMEEASTIVSTLVRYCSLDPITHVMTYDVFSRRGKLLHCLQALVQLHKLSGGDITAYKLVGPLAHFCFVAELEGEAVNATVREVVLAELATLFLGKDAAPFASVAAMRVEASKAMDKTEQRLKDTSDLPFIEVLYGLKAMKHAGRDCRKFLESWKPTGALSLKDSNKMLKYLGAEFGSDSKIYQACKAHCLTVFPLMVA